MGIGRIFISRLCKTIWPGQCDLCGLGEVTAIRVSMLLLIVEIGIVEEGLLKRGDIRGVFGF
ncbi:MAG: hypothetical protein CBC48_11755 [bacterium TMED88]|nr:hypothetical protein [Deltaproteobacteria bacterium]OUV29591.1 MAG: hypothetical protein CBC48_11755 [bacterium TMED88]